MPRIIRTALFSKEETRILARAAQFVDIALPLRSDPLVQRSPEAVARAVDDTDQRRRALAGLLSPFDPISYPRLRAAADLLDLILTQMVKESDVDHWLSLSDTPDHPQSQQMAEVLAAERSGQQRLVREAIALVGEALVLVTEADDPRPQDRRTDHGGFPNPATTVETEQSG